MNEFKLHPKDYGFNFVAEIFLNIRCISKSNSKARWLEKRFKDFEDLIILTCKKHSHLKTSDKETGFVIIKLSFKGRRIDLNNSTKSIMDALVKARIFKDDRDVAVTVLPADLGKEDKIIIQIWR